MQLQRVKSTKKSTHTQHQQIQIVHYTILLVGVSIVRDFFFHHRLHLNHLVNCMRCFCQHIFINTIGYCWILIIYRCWLCVASSFWSLLSFFFVFSWIFGDDLYSPLYIFGEFHFRVRFIRHSNKTMQDNNNNNNKKNEAKSITA